MTARQPRIVAPRARRGKESCLSVGRVRDRVFGSGEREGVYTSAEAGGGVELIDNITHRLGDDFVQTDSSVEQRFAHDLDTSAEVIVYAKLPKGFGIPTPVGDYNPNWAIAFQEGAVKHIYFVAETKGSMSSMEFREIEKARIECARKFYRDLDRDIAPDSVRYEMVDSF